MKKHFDCAVRFLIVFILAFLTIFSCRMATAENIPLVFNSDKPNISVKLNNNVSEELILKTDSIRIVPITSVKKEYKAMSVINVTFKIKKLNDEQVKVVKKEISSETIYNK